MTHHTTSLHPAPAVCPRCSGPVYEHARSRATDDRAIAICAHCAVDEWAEQLDRGVLTLPPHWPVAADLIAARATKYGLDTDLDPDPVTAALSEKYQLPTGAISDGWQLDRQGRYERPFMWRPHGDAYVAGVQDDQGFITHYVMCSHESDCELTAEQARQLAANLLAAAAQLETITAG